MKIHPRLSSSITLLLLGVPTFAQEPYRTPAPDVVAVVDAEPEPRVQFSPDGRWMLFVERDALPSIADLSRRMLRLAGTRVDPAADGGFRTIYSKGLSLRALDGEKAVRVPLPEGARVGSVSWSHHSNAFTWVLVSEEGSELWCASVEHPDEPRKLTDRLNTITGGPRWMPDGQHILCRLVPAGRGEEPAAPKVPVGPNIQDTSGDTSPLRTYQDLLASPHDEALFEYYATTQLALLDATGGDVRSVGKPAMFAGATPSPDGEHLLVTVLERPFSYLMPWWLFPQRIEVIDHEGSVQHTVARIPLGEGIPIGGVRTGPRQVTWKAGAPATLLWAEALDGGDPKREAEHRDRWMAASFPFDEPARELLRLEQRATGVSFFEQPDWLLTREYDRDRRWTRSLLFDLSQPEAAPRVLDDRSVRDRYADPGRIVTRTDETGKGIAWQDGDWVYRSGSGASPEGMLPFLDRQNLASLASERLWRCEEGSYESVVDLLSSSAAAKPTAITRHETPESPPNYRTRDLESGTSTALTHFEDPTPQLRGIHKELVKYEREDGVQLSATLYLPAGHQAGERLPLVVWAYPREFNDAKTAGQIGSSPWRFTRIAGTSHLHLLSRGYAIMDGATMPIIGDPETMNDTFIEQLVGAARAAIDKAVEMGVADGTRTAVGGHSYGAFMTANLLAHSDLFQAGLARSGAYNRTLTPFGFQAERRTLWEAPEIYFAISPFMHADTIDEPLLLIHGEIDNNSGTFPLQSRRLFQAIKGNGGTARLVMLPGESHGYRARESVLQVLAEMIDWLDEHLVPADRPSEAGFSEGGR